MEKIDRVKTNQTHITDPLMYYIHNTYWTVTIVFFLKHTEIVCAYKNEEFIIKSQIQLIWIELCGAWLLWIFRVLWFRAYVMCACNNTLYCIPRYSQVNQKENESEQNQNTQPKTIWTWNRCVRKISKVFHNWYYSSFLLPFSICNAISFPLAICLFTCLPFGLSSLSLSLTFSIKLSGDL